MDLKGERADVGEVAAAHRDAGAALFWPGARRHCRDFRQPGFVEEADRAPAPRKLLPVEAHLDERVAGQG